MNQQSWEEKPAERSGLRREVWEWVRALAIAAILFFVIRSFIFAPVIVKGDSMSPTLQNGERLFVTKLVYLLGEPKRGDIVVFHASETRDYVKRIIGLPGEMIEVRGDELYINGERVAEPYLEAAKEAMRGTGRPLTEDFPPVVVPEGEYFVMGDNRGDSQDSRIIGTISKDRLVGRADFVFWPPSQMRLLHDAR